VVPGIAAVVVNYNGGDHLANCVSSIRAAGIDSVVVVDNGSTDGSPARLASTDHAARVLLTGANLGYGGGANRGVAATDAPFLLILNADVIVDEHAVASLVDVVTSDPSIGIVGPRIEEPDGSLYPSARAFPRLGDAIGHAFIGLFTTDNPFSRRYLMTDVDHRTPRTADWVSGACFLIRRDAFDRVRGFDEAYFMYMEEVDLCRRVGAAGWTVRYEPGARVRHVGAVSTSQTPYLMLAAHHRSMARYWWRSARGTRKLMAPLVAAGLGLRFLLMAAKQSVQGRSRQRRRSN
jgi:N-acetylglucosaminyl-diphospho-decaprenol L-rhamnosyltransferase